MSSSTGNRTLDARRFDAITAEDDNGRTVTVQRHGAETQRWVRCGVLGRGSFGVVYEEMCEEGPEGVVGTARAVKELAKPMTAGGQAELGRELSIQFMVSGSGVCERFARAHGWWETATHVCIAMDCYDHGNLVDNLRRPLPEAEAALVARQLLEAVQFLHKKHVTHRDIKPENLMVKSNATTGGWDVKLGDFGLCERHKDVTRPGILTNKGTPDFMGPEFTTIDDDGDDDENGTPPPPTSLFDQQVKADVWAIGQTVHMLLTKQLSGGHPGSLEAAGISPSVIRFVNGLLRPDPSKRPTIAQALAHPWIRATKA